jgi:hypothetical protein
VLAARWCGNSERGRQLEAFKIEIEEAHIAAFSGLHVHIDYDQGFVRGEVRCGDSHIFRAAVPPGFDPLRVRGRPIGEVLDGWQLGVLRNWEDVKAPGGQAQREF